MEFTLLELRKLSAQCTALSGVMVLGFMTDIALDAMQALAVKRIERDPDFKVFQTEKKTILDAIEKEDGYKALTDDQKRNRINTSTELLALLEKEKKEFWDKTVDDIEFTPVKLDQSKVNYEKLQSLESIDVITLDSMQLSIPLYPSLKELIRKGLIIVE